MRENTYERWFHGTNEDGKEYWEPKEFHIATAEELEGEKKIKYYWTECGLTNFLQTLGCGVDKCIYIYLPEIGEEIVRITYEGGGHHDVWVTGDSKLGMIKGIMEARIW